MRQVNIAFITDRMIKGHGVDLVVDRLADGLAKKDYICKVYCNYFDETFISRKSYDIINLPSVKPTNPIIFEKRVRKLSKYFNSKEIDLFIINTFPFYSLIPLLKKPVIAIDYGIISTKDLPLRRKLFYKYMQFSQNISYFRKADKIVSISKFLLESLPKYLRKKADYIYPGCNHYQQKKIYKEDVKNFRENLGINPEDILLLYVGRLNPTNQPYKGVEELIEIFHKVSLKLKNIKLLMLGYGSKNDEEYLKNQGILAISNAPEELMPLVYSSCDIYVTCSKWEGFDLPVVEAQSFGKPAICYSTGAHPEVLLNEKTGFTVSNNLEFIKKLNSTTTDNKLRENMGKNAISYSKKFYWENTINSYESKIKELLNLKDYRIEPKDISGKNKEVAVVIINYNSSYPCLKECIESLKNQTYKHIKMLIFDNNSINDTLKTISSKYKDIKIIYNNKNLGLGEGINRALNHVNSKYILISNFDVIYDSKVVEEFVNQINKLDSSYIGLAPKIKFFYQKDYIESVGLYLDKSFYTGYHGIGQLDLNQYDLPENIFGVSFTSCFLKKDVFSEDKVGTIDPTFFLFYEDIDFCYRANLLGYKFKSCPLAVCYHKYAYSFRDDATSFQTKYYYQKLNLLKTVYKNAEMPNLKRILDIELNIQKKNLKDTNLKPVAKKILKNFKQSLKYLKNQRENIQLLRNLSDKDIFKYCWGEYNFFNFVENTPIHSIINLHRTYQRLYIITGNEKYKEHTDYLINIESTKFRIENEFLKRLLHDKLKYEPASVHKFIDKIE